MTCLRKFITGTCLLLARVADQSRCLAGERCVKSEDRLKYERVPRSWLRRCSVALLTCLCFEVHVRTCTVEDLEQIFLYK